MGARSNKSIGTAFEREVCDLLARNGYWVHFIVPDARGAQPFDIIAMKDGIAHAIDCKTNVANTFNYSRLEENQIMAFEKWIKCGGTMPIIAVKHNGRIYAIEYDKLKAGKSIGLNDSEQEAMYFWDDERSDST